MHSRIPDTPEEEEGKKILLFFFACPLTRIQSCLSTEALCDSKSSENNL